ncbi:class I SAM-dependent methyltransferase, partial [Pelagibacteraceae bacterium]|nr:class I SAM-dependent methyltransferase [Pelagibacteraceae bacterium]
YMIKKLLYLLSKKASRKSLYKNILISFGKIKNEKTKLLNIGSGGDIENLITNNFEDIFSVDIDPKRNPNQVIDVCEDHFSQNLKYKPNLVCCFEVLEHTTNPQKAVNNIYSILDKGDFCLVSVPFNFHIHDEPNDFYRFTFYGLKMLFKNFSEVKIIKKNGWLESIFVNIIRLEKEKNILSKNIGRLFILLYFLLMPIIIIIQKIIPSEKLTTGYFVEAKK